MSGNTIVSSTITPELVAKLGGSEAIDIIGAYVLQAVHLCTTDTLDDQERLAEAERLPQAVQADARLNEAAKAHTLQCMAPALEGCV